MKAIAAWLFLVCACSLPAETAMKLPPREKLHLYLLMGQSNMAGRGAVEQEDKTPHPRVIVLRTNDMWAPAMEPITFDRPTIKPGVGPGVAFGKSMAESNPNVTIGLVPCAVGGTPLIRWSRGGDLYSNAVYRAKIAMKDGTLKGICWHQGENDAIHEKDARTYAVRLQKMLHDIREDLNTPNLPIVVGEIGEFLYSRKDPTKTPYAKMINEALRELPSKVPHTACALSSGLKDKGDEVHFDTPSQREFGKRYAKEMIKLQMEK